MSHILNCFPKAEFIIFEVQLKNNLKNLSILNATNINQHRSQLLTFFVEFLLD